jgi:hypothetical protein
MSLFPRTARQAALGLVILVGSGTAAAQQPEELTSKEKAFIKYFGGNLTLKPSLSKDTIKRSDLPSAALKESTATFLETWGPQKGKLFTRTIKATKHYPKTWPVSPVGAVTETIPGNFVYYKILDISKGLIAPVELDVHAAIQAAYEPGELLVPIGPKIEPYDMKVLVYNIADPTKVSHSGSLKVTAQDRGQWSVSVPGGTYECVMFTIEFDGKVGPASVKDMAIVFVNLEQGVIARITRTKVSAFLVYNTEDRFSYVLAKSNQ